MDALLQQMRKPIIVACAVIACVALAFGPTRTAQADIIDWLRQVAPSVVAGDGAANVDTNTATNNAEQTAEAAQDTVDSNLVFSGEVPNITQPDKLMTYLVSDFFRSGSNVLLGLADGFYQTLFEGALIGGDLNDPSFQETKRKVIQVLNSVVQPVGLALLGLFLGIELLRMARDSSQEARRINGLGSIEAWVVFGIKYYILYVLITNAWSLMYAIFSIFQWLSTHIQQLFGSYTANAGLIGIFDEMYAQLTYTDAIGIMLIVFIISFVVVVITGLTCIYAQVLCIVRIFEIFVGVAMSPIPLAAFAARQTSEIGKSYIKWFAGACLQLAVLFLIVGLGGPLIHGLSITILGENYIMSAIAAIASSAAMYMMLKQSRNIANRLVGA